MQLQRYSTEISKVGLIATLLRDTTLTWFGPLNEQNFHYLKILKHLWNNFVPHLEMSTKQERQTRNLGHFNKAAALHQYMLMSLDNCHAMSIGNQIWLGETILLEIK